MSSRVQIPLGHPIATQGSMVNQQWAFFFQQLQQSLAPIGSGFVVDGSASTYAPATLFQGPESTLGTPSIGDLFFAIDTGKIYAENAGTWELLSPALSGAVIKPAGSLITTLNSVNSTPGTWGTTNLIPQINVGSDGRITSIIEVPVTAPPLVAAGPNTSVQFNNFGSFSGSPNFSFIQATNTVNLVNLFSTGTINQSGVISSVSNVLGNVGWTLAGRSTNGTILPDKLTFKAGGLLDNSTSGADLVLGGSTTSLGGDFNLSAGNGISSKGNGTFTAQNLFFNAGSNSLEFSGLGELKINSSAGTAGQVLSSNGTGSSVSWTDTGISEVIFNFGDASPKSLLTISPNKTIISTEIVILTAFNDVSAELSIGDAGTSDLLQEVTDNSPTTEGSYITVPGISFNSSTALLLTISPGLSSAGAGLVRITYQR